MTGLNAIAGKIREVKEEMKRAGIWKRQVPAWVNEFEKRTIMSREDFSEWLQFVYLPNLVQKEWQSHLSSGKLIVPQAIQFFGEDVNKGKLLQLLIELDSLV